MLRDVKDMSLPGIALIAVAEVPPQPRADQRAVPVHAEIVAVEHGMNVGPELRAVIDPAPARSGSRVLDALPSRAPAGSVRGWALLPSRTRG